MADFDAMNEIMKKIKRKYDKDPENWNVAGGTDQDGNHDMFFHQAPDTYWLKSKQISPYQYLSLGSELKNIDMEIQNKIGNPSGQSAQDLLRMFGMAVPTEKKEMILASGLEYHSQPFANQIKSNVDEKNPNFARDMNKEIENLFRKKYPQRSGMFI